MTGYFLLAKFIFCFYVCIYKNAKKNKANAERPWSIEYLLHGFTVKLKTNKKKQLNCSARREFLYSRPV